MNPWQILEGDALAVLADLPSDTFDCCVTSPPYWRMRDYGHPGQIGMEESVEAFVERLADVFDSIRRVLKPTGTLWVNIGDSYQRRGGGRAKDSDMGRRYLGTPPKSDPQLKGGDLAGIPWALAFELRARGWYLRGEQIWAKSNPIPEKVTSRPHRAHEHVFLLTKSPSPGYYYDADAVQTPLTPKTMTTVGTIRRAVGADDPGAKRGNVRAQKYPRARWLRLDENGDPAGARLRSVWALPGNANRDNVQHFAMMPHKLVEVCVASGCPPGGSVIDPFAGAGTVGVVSLRMGRDFTGIELVPESAELARRQISGDAPLLNVTSEKGLDNT